MNVYIFIKLESERIHKLRKYQNKLNDLLNGSLDQNKLNFVLEKISLYGGVESQNNNKTNNSDIDNGNTKVDITYLSGNSVGKINIVYDHEYTYYEFKKIIDKLDINGYFFLVNGDKIIYDSLINGLPKKITIGKQIKQLNIVKQNVSSDTIEQINRWFRSGYKDPDIFINQLKETTDEHFLAYTKYLLSKNIGFFDYLGDLKKDKEFVLEVVKYNSLSLIHVSDELKKDKDIVLKIVKQNGHSLQFVSDELKKDKDVVLEAVKQNGFSLRHAPEELTDDRDVALEAVKNDGMSLSLVKTRLRGDKEIVLEAIKQNGYAIRYASNNLKSDKEIILTTIEHNDFLLSKVIEFVKTMI